MLNDKKKKLIIVSGEKEMVYAEFLSSLISMNDDDEKTQTILGIPDGSVEAVVWNEKIYNDNKIQIGSNAKIIFIGKTKPAELIIPSIKFKDFTKFGINIGWIGNKAVIYITDNVLLADRELYDEFFELYTEITNKFDNSVADTEGLKKAKLTDGIDVAFEKSIGTVGKFFDGLFKKQKEEKLQAKGTDFFDFGAKIEAANLVPSQMYRYAILNFYIASLSKFMEINE